MCVAKLRSIKSDEVDDEQILEDESVFSNSVLI